MTVTELLKTFPAFSRFDGRELEIIAKYFTAGIYEKGQVIREQGSVHGGIFLIAAGKVELTLDIPGSIKRKHGQYGPGDICGGISLAGNKPALNTYCAAERTVIVSVTEENIVNLIGSDSRVAAKFISRLLGMTIRQFRKSSKFLAHVVQWGENASRRTITDELTGLYNRAFLDDALVNFFNISRSNNKPLSLLMIDLDNFRAINERYSIETGNRILKEVVLVMKNIIERHGIIARYGGGDEYSILLPETGLGKARDIAESIRRAVEAHDFSRHFPGEAVPLTVSIGISSFPETARELASFREKADSSLYQAKNSGKNRISSIA